MTEDTSKDNATSSQEPPPQYGTFQGVANYPPPQQPVTGFPQPVAPPGVTQQQQQQQEGSAAPHYSHGYQNVHGYAVAEGHPVRQPRLPCCGCGIGWFLFIVGWFLAAIPWYVGAVVLLCNKRIDPREKPGYIACTIAAILSLIAILFGATKGADAW